MQPLQGCRFGLILPISASTGTSVLSVCLPGCSRGCIQQLAIDPFCLIEAGGVIAGLYHTRTQHLTPSHGCLGRLVKLSDIFETECRASHMPRTEYAANHFRRVYRAKLLRTRATPNQGQKNIRQISTWFGSSDRLGNAGFKWSEGRWHITGKQCQEKTSMLSFRRSGCTRECGAGLFLLIRAAFSF